MKRIGILTAGGDTPALNATIHGAVVRANQLRIEIVGFIKGFNCLFNPRDRKSTRLNSSPTVIYTLSLTTLFRSTPALNATIHGAVVRANQLRIEIVGFIKGFNCLFNP